MSKAVFFSLPAHGHINPTLPIVKGLASRGEEIVYYASDEFRERIEENGGAFRTYVTEPGEGQDFHTENIVKLAEILLTMTGKMLPRLLEDMDRLQPDYVLHDSMSPWGWAVAQSLKLPAICSTSTFAFSPDVTKEMTGKSETPLTDLAKIFLTSGFSIFKIPWIARELQKNFQIPAGGHKLIDVFSNRSDLNLVYTSREFQPLGESFDASYRFVGPLIRETRGDSEFPWKKLEGKTVIYISLGTIRNLRPDFYRACFKALAGSDVLVVTAVGKQTDIDSLGEIPDNFIVRDYAPQIDILKRADLFITHAGMNSANEGLYFNVPLLLFPQTAEQRFVARRVVELGAGMLLKEAEQFPDIIRERVHDLLDNPSYARAAKDIGDSFRKAGGCDRALHAIEAFKNTYLSA